MFVFLFSCVRSAPIKSAAKPDIKVHGFYCNGEPNIYNLGQLDECENKTENVSNKTTRIAVVQTLQYIEIEYIQCRVKYEIDIAKCGGWGVKNRHIKHYNYLKDLTYDECKAIGMTGDYRVEGKTVRLEKGEGAIHGAEFAGEAKISWLNMDYCEGDYYEDHYGVKYDRVLVIGNILVKKDIGDATADIFNNLLNLPNGVPCKLDKFKCFHDEYGYTFWEEIQRSPSSSCDKKEDKFIILYSGEAVETLDSDLKKRFFIKENDLYFFVEEKSQLPKKICGEYMLFSTQLKNIYILHDVSQINLPAEIFYLRSNLKISKKNYIFENTIHMTVDYPMFDIYSDLNKFIAIQNHVNCIQNREEMIMKINQIKRDPSLFGDLILKKPGYQSFIRGDFLYVVGCDLVEVSLRNTKNCYNEIPIFYLGKEEFLLPDSKIIIPDGTFSDCQDGFPIAYNFGNELIELTPSGEWNILHNKTGIFSFSLRNITIPKAKKSDKKPSIYGFENEAAYMEALRRPYRNIAKDRNFFYNINARKNPEEIETLDFWESLQSMQWMQKVFSWISLIGLFLVFVFFVWLLSLCIPIIAIPFDWLREIVSRIENRNAQKSSNE